MLLPWTTRGLKYESRQYLGSLSLDAHELIESAPKEHLSGPIHPDMPFTSAVPILVDLRGAHGQGIEYGCFHLDGTLIEDPGFRLRRQIRNILYYTIRDLFNISRGQDRYGPGAMTGDDPVPDDPEGNWAVIMSEGCPSKEDVERALQPLVEHRSGSILTIPQMDPGTFTHWLADQFNNKDLPPYLFICDSFDNIPLEYQVIFNAFAVTGRLWFDDPASFASYVTKILSVERGGLKTGPRRVAASPADDDVTYADYQHIVLPMLDFLKQEAAPIEMLVHGDFHERSLLEAARDSHLLALYCHGLGLNQDDWARRPQLQGAFVLKYGSREAEGLLTPKEVTDGPFVPGGIVFTPACMGGGTQQDSDFAAWVEDQSLPAYLGTGTKMSDVSRAMLESPDGPAAVLAHFDVSMGGSSPMFNPRSQEHDLQKALHTQFIGSLLQGHTIGRATEPFRWAAGAFYAQAIYIFGQIAGSVPYFRMSGRRRTVGEMVSSMNQYHVVASDMRNYLVLGDPAVHLPE